MSHAVDLSHYRAIDSIGYLLRRAHKLAVPLAEEAFVGEELSFTQWVALVLLRDELATTSGGLARCLDHNSGATTRLVDHLAARGLLVRQRSEADRRIVHLALTDAGRAAVERLIPRIVALWDALSTGFAPGEFDMLTSLLKRLVERLDAESIARAPA